MDSSYRLETLEPRLLLSGSGLGEQLLAANAPALDPLTTTIKIDASEEITGAHRDLHAYAPEQQLVDLFDTEVDQTTKSEDAPDENVSLAIPGADPLEGLASGVRASEKPASEHPAAEPPPEEPVVATQGIEILASGMEGLDQSERKDSVVGASFGASDQLSSADKLVQTLDAANPPPFVHLTPDLPLVLPNGLTVESLTGTGTVFGDVLVSGLCSPGDSPGKLDIVGDYTLLNGEVEPGGFVEGGTILHIEIGGLTAGSQYDQLNVTGTLTIGGTLKIELIDDYTPQAGDTFTLLTYGQLQGEFAAIEGLPIGQGLYFDVQQDAEKLELVVSDIGNTTNIQSVIGDILDQYASGAVSGETTISPGDVQLGGWAEINSPTLVFDITYDPVASTWSGSVGIECGNASIFIGDGLRAGIVDADGDQIALEGAYTLANTSKLGGRFDLTADRFDLVIPDLLTATATGVSLGYDPDGPVDQMVFELDALSVKLTPLDDTGIEIDDLVVRTDGFSLANATIVVDQVGWAGVLTVNTLSLSFQDIDYSTTSDDLAGTIEITAASAGVFEDQSAFYAAAEGIAGNYDLATADLSLAVATLAVQVGDLLQVSAEEVGLSLDPFELTISSTAASSPRFPELSGSASDLRFSETGFTVAAAELSTTATIDFGAVLRVSGLSMTATNFGYTIDPDPMFAGQIALSVGAVELFPDADVNATVADLTVTVDLSPGHEGELLIEAEQFTLALDGFLATRSP